MDHAPQTVGPNRNLANAAFMLGLFAILGALAFQHIGGLFPCELCLTQRWPYYIGLPILVLALIVWDRVAMPIRAGALGIVAALFAWGTWVGVYHAGAEYGFWPGPQTCSGTGDAAVSLDMLSDMSDSQVVACDVVQWELLGVSLAGFNALISGTIVVLLVLSIVGQIRRSH